MSKIKGVFVKLGTKQPGVDFTYALDTVNVQVQSLTVNAMGNPHAPNGCTHSFSLNFTIDNVSAGPKADGYEIGEIHDTCAAGDLTFWAFQPGKTELDPDTFGILVAGDGQTPKASLQLNYVMSTGKVNSSAGPVEDANRVLKIFKD